MATLKELFLAMSKEGKAQWRQTQSGKDQLLLKGKGVIVGNGEDAIAIYSTNLKEFASYECIEEAELYKLKRVATRQVEPAEAESYFEEVATPAKKTRKGS